MEGHHGGPEPYGCAEPRRSSRSHPVQLRSSSWSSEDAMSAGLKGTGLVADDLYLMAHHELTGKPFLQPRPLGIGLAAALVAELMLVGSVRVTVEGAAVWPRTLPGGELACQVQRVLAG